MLRSSTSEITFRSGAGMRLWMTLPPSGSGKPSFSRPHHTPKSSQQTSPSFSYVNWPSWMISPTSASPRFTVSKILSNGTTV